MLNLDNRLIMLPTEYYTCSMNDFLRIPELNLCLDHSFKDLELLDAAIFRMTNEERMNRYLSPLKYHAKLRQVALTHSEQMSAHDFCDHVNPFETRYGTLEDRLRSVCDDSFGGFVGLSENIIQYPTLMFRGQSPFTSSVEGGVRHFYEMNGNEIHFYTCRGFADAVVSAWMNSRDHRKNILNPETEYMGCGSSKVYHEYDDFTLESFNVTQDFGRHLSFNY